MLLSIASKALFKMLLNKMKGVVDTNLEMSNIWFDQQRLMWYIFCLPMGYGV